LITSIGIVHKLGNATLQLLLFMINTTDLRCSYEYIKYWPILNLKLIHKLETN